MILGLLSIFVLLEGGALWTLNTQIAGAVVASGLIEVEQNRQIVQHSTGGVVDKINVQEGNVVRTGSVLMQLDTHALVSELSLIEGQYFAVLAQMGYIEALFREGDQITFGSDLRLEGERNTRVQELIEGQQMLWQARRAADASTREKTKNQRAQILTQITGFNARRASLDKQLKLISLDQADQQSLFDRGLAAAVPLRAIRREKARLIDALGEVDAARTHAHERLIELRIESNRRLAQVKEQAIRKFRELRQEQFSLNQKRLVLRTEIEGMSIRAPVSGIVYDLRVRTPRAVIGSAEPLMYLIPQDRPLLIAARVSPNNISQVRLGQHVTLRLSALDKHSTPELQGKVRHISADTIDDTRTGLAYFRVEVTLSAQELGRLDPGTPLRLGMPVEAFIVLEERTPMEFILKPMTDYFARAFRES